MPKSLPASSIPWIATTLRWFILITATVQLATKNSLSLPIMIVLLLAALWNVLVAMLIALDHHSLTLQWVSIGVDVLIAGSLFWLGNGFAGPLIWIGILPLLPAILYDQPRGGFIVTLINVAMQSALGWDGNPLPTVGLWAGFLFVLYALVTLAVTISYKKFHSALEKDQARQASAWQQSERMSSERQRAIYNLVSTLSASLNYQRVLDAALDLTSQALATATDASDGMVSAVLLFSGSESNELQVGSARRFTTSDMRISLPGHEGLLGITIEEGEPRLSQNLQEDGELCRILALRNCQAAYCIPLRMGVDTYGVLLFAHPEADFFNADRRDVLEIVAKQAVTAMQNARLYQALEQEKERMMEIQEEARKKMARDLHDGPTQSVSAIAMRVNFARRLMERDAKAAGEELFKIEEMARRTTKEIRHMLFTLRPLVLESQGLFATLNSMAEKMRETFNQNVIVQADQKIVDALEGSKQAVVFYIVDEAVNNARKHAKAAHIWVRIKRLRDNLALLEIEDDGVGFDLDAVDSAYENRGSLGMVNLKERAELVNGVLHIDAAPGRGTKIQVAIPLNEDGAELIRRGL